MYRSYNNERRDIIESEIAKEQSRMQFEASIHGVKKKLSFKPVDLGGDDDEEDTKDLKNSFAAIEGRVQKQVEKLRTRAAMEGARSGRQPNDQGQS